MHKMNTRQNKFFFIVMNIVIFIQPLTTSAQTHFTLDGRARTKPQSVNLVGSLAYDHLLWGDRTRDAKDPMFGFVSVGTRFGGSPTISGYVQIAPISPVILEVERSMTQRFGRSVNFPCDSIECKGRIDRTDVTLKLAGAYHDFVFLGSFLRRELTTMNSDNEVMIELEDLIVSPGTHRLSEASGFVGMNLSEQNTIGVAYAAGIMADSPRGYESTYLVYRIRKDDLVITVGAGNYKSDYATLNGFSAIASVARTWGESLSLF
jgi:hypothetical protein